MAVEDTTHVTFWRRLVRWLVDGVPDPVALTTAVDRVEPGESMKLTAEVVDPAFVEVNDAQVVAQVTSPSGKITEVPLEWTVSKDGEYKGAFVADEAGLYEVKTDGDARRARRSARTCMHARASAGDSEYFDAAMRSTLLNRIAEETGGHFFTPANAAELPEAINYSGRGVTVVEERDLWDMPIILMVILGLIAADWGYRRTSRARVTIAVRRRSWSGFSRPSSFAVRPPLARAVAGRRAGHPRARHRRRRRRRGARQEVQQVGAGGRRRREETRRAGGQHHLSRREPGSERRQDEGARDARERHQGVHRPRRPAPSRTTRSSSC